MRKHIDDQFTDAEFNWNLIRLYKALSAAKSQPLTPMEKAHLRGLLCGYSPAEIAEKLHKNIKGVEVDLSKTIYQYVKILVKKDSVEVNNWRNISEWLEQAGYKIPSSFPSSQSSPPSSQQSSQQPSQQQPSQQNIDIHAQGQAKVINTVYRRGNLVIDFGGKIDFRGKLIVPLPKGEDDREEKEEKSVGGT